MSKSERKKQMDACLRTALKRYHAASGLSQEALAEKLGMSQRACSALENGEYGFSAYSIFMLFALLPLGERVSLLFELCEIAARPSHKVA